MASENSDNWTWFLDKLRTHITHDRDIMFVSDRAGDLLHAFNDVYEKPLHFYCLYHLMKNVKSMYSAKKWSKTWKNHLCKLLKDAAYAPTEHYYNIAIERFVQKGGEKAQCFLQDLPKDKWAVAFAPDVHRYGELTSNAAESFNNWILPARGLPITFMLDTIRTQLMEWFTERRADSNKWTGALTPDMEKEWNTSLTKGENWTIVPTNRHGVFEVLAKDNVVVIFPLVGPYCSHL